MKLPVLSAADGAAWEERLVTAFERGPYPVEIVRRCVDIVDVLAVAASGQGRAALLAAGLRRLDAEAVDRLTAAGVVPIGVVRRGDEGAEDRLRASGIQHTLPEDADPGVVASVVAEAVRAGGSVAPGAAATQRAQRAYADPSTSMAIPPGEGEPVPVRDPGRRGSVIAIWGPTGAPGRTTVAVNLADEVAGSARARCWWTPTCTAARSRQSWDCSTSRPDLLRPAGVRPRSVSTPRRWPACAGNSPRSCAC